jgi:hypothetical protein
MRLFAIFSPTSLRTLVIFTCAATLLLSCGGNKKPKGGSLLTGDEDNQEVSKDDNSSAPPFSKEVLGDIVRSIPSPLEISFLIKDLGIKYDRGLLNTTEKANDYNTSFKQALNLGIYSTDLGYANIYGQTNDALQYLTAVKIMTDGLKIGDYFDFNTLKDLATNSNNLDSLLLVTNTSLERINEHLQKKDRADQTILILTGGWLEALYLTCEIAKRSPNDLLNNRIGEQKIILDQLLLLLSFYEEEFPKIKDLRNDLIELQKIYNRVEITFVYEEASTKEQEGILIVEDQATSKIKFTSKDLEDILAKSKEIRAKITE